MKIQVKPYTLNFKKPAKTSRDVLQSRDIWYLVVEDESGTISGIGECAPIWGLSPESKSDIENFLSTIQESLGNMAQLQKDLNRLPSIRFALESALRDLSFGGKRILFDFNKSIRIPINGLVWMNEKNDMIHEARLKIESGFKVIKFKVGALNFEEELDMLRIIRQEFPWDKLTIRLDANGAFHPDEALDKLERLSEFHIHSIEQPIKARQWDAMAELVKTSPIPIALDEELIAVSDRAEKEKLLDTIRPQFIILKPTLHGGFSGCDEWIELAQKRFIEWWATSALESNIGLNAIAQWVATKDNKLAQGLGTGALYTNNVESPLVGEDGYFFWKKRTPWKLDQILTHG